MREKSINNIQISTHPLRYAIHMSAECWCWLKSQIPQLSPLGTCLSYMEDLLGAGISSFHWSFKTSSKCRLLLIFRQKDTHTYRPICTCKRIYVYASEYFSIILKRHNRFHGDWTSGGSLWPVFHLSTHTAFFLMQANMGKLMCAPSNLQPAATLNLSCYPSMCAPSLCPPMIRLHILVLSARRK